MLWFHPLAVPLQPGPGFSRGPAAPWTVHLLGLAIVWTVASRLAAGSWRRIADGFRGTPPPAGVPLWLALVGLAVAYGLERAISLPLLGLLPAGGGVAGSSIDRGRLLLLNVLWYARLTPYLIVALLVPRLARVKDAGPRLSLTRASWTAVAPAFRASVPWAVFFLLIWSFPRLTPGSFGREMANTLDGGVRLLVTCLLTLPLFLGVLMPSLGRGIHSLARYRAARSLARRRGDGEGGIAARVITIVLGAAVALAWTAVSVLEPGLGGLGWGHYLRIFAYYGAFYVAAALIQDADRSIFWPALASAVIFLGMRIVPAVLGLFFVW
jgi:hypothetical protein